MPVFCVFLLGQIFLIQFCLRLWVWGFCLESLILAQDERWRRANTYKSNGKGPSGYTSGEQVSNTWVICPALQG